MKPTLFVADNIKTFCINKVKFSIHDFALKKASIFAPLFDTSIDSKELLDITLPDIGATDQIIGLHIDKIISLLYGESINNLFEKSSVEYIVQILTIMMYLGFETDLIKRVTILMLREDKSVIDELGKITNFHDCMNIIIDSYTCKLTDDEIFNLVETISKTNHPNQFKVKLISRFIRSNLNIKNFDIVLAITCEFKYECDSWNRPSNIVDIANYKSFTRSLYKMYLKQDIVCDFQYYSIPVPVHLATILINKKPIELVEYKNTYTKGTYGGNIMMSVVAHISKILLGLEIL